MYFKNWNIEEMTGYKPISTFYMDFSIADRFGTKAVKSTYKQAFSEWRSDYRMMTELVMVLNWKIWEHYQHSETLASLYNELWTSCSSWCEHNLKDSELQYYFSTTD